MATPTPIEKMLNFFASFEVIAALEYIPYWMCLRVSTDLISATIPNGVKQHNKVNRDNIR
jgi:hypothetical protein